VNGNVKLGRAAARSGEWAQHFSNASCFYRALHRIYHASDNAGTEVDAKRLVKMLTEKNSGQSRRPIFIVDSSPRDAGEY